MFFKDNRVYGLQIRFEEVEGSVTKIEKDKQTKNTEKKGTQNIMEVLG